MSTISWSYSAAGAGDAKASPAEACTMVVENVRAAWCREDERGEKEDLAWCWATNLELQSGALGPALATMLRDAARAKLRLAMKLIVCGVRGRKSEEERVPGLQQLSQWLFGERRSVHC